MSQAEVRKNRTQAVLQKMKELGYDPLDAMIKIAQDDRVELETRIDCHKTLIKYVYPTLKHVEIDAQIKSDLVVQIKQFVKPSNIVQIEEKRSDKQLTGSIDEDGGDEEDYIDLKAAGGLQGHPSILAD